MYQPVADDGYYKIIVLEHEGDTRGNPWYSNIVCLAVDMSANANQATSDTIPVPNNIPVQQSDPPITGDEVYGPPIPAETPALTPTPDIDPAGLPIMPLPAL
jgi:hypothetical protein